MFPALFRRELVRQLARFGGQTAAGRFCRVVELLWRGALRLFHNGFNLPLRAGDCKKYVATHGSKFFRFPLPLPMAN